VPPALRLPAGAALLLAAVACRAPAGGDEGVTFEDADGDGVTADIDCDDDDREAAPGILERCDGKDNDCDGRVDEPDADGARRWYVDEDRDGWGRDRDEFEVGCAPPDDRRYAGRWGDCDDLDANANDGLLERCDDQTDNDCDGQIDEFDEHTDPETAGRWYPDADGDGYGDDALPVLACDRPTEGPALTVAGGDCDDGNPLTHPGAAFEELPGLCTRDEDGDGYGDNRTGLAWTPGTDCDDDQPTVNPGAAEDCDGVDTTCAGGLSLDEQDLDADRWVACAVVATGWLGDPAVRGGGDCAALRADRHPAADETCDGEDDDCDGEIDESSAIDAPEWLPDADGDGHGGAGPAVRACAQPPGAAAATAARDCDDGDPTASPSGVERCGDGVDGDCDGIVDGPTAVDAATWYADVDGDGHGGPVSLGPACEAPARSSAAPTDCDDLDPEVSPDATERCSGADDDCDGLVDDDDPSVRVDAPWYLDADADGWGDASAPWLSCEPPEGFVADAGDCDDGDGGVSPDADELCRNGVDDDCDGLPTGCEATGTLSVLAADAAIAGQVGFEAVGAVVAMGDISGDGVPDVLVGATGTRSGGQPVGAALLYFGPVSGTLSPADADATLLGDITREAAGAALAVADLTDDGRADLVVGSCAPVTSPDSRGRAFIFAGPLSAGALALSAADLVLQGDDQDDALGCALSAAGDLTGDGLADLIVGAPGLDGGGAEAGGVWIFTGPLDAGAFADEALIAGESAGDLGGTAIATGLDVDGDGQDDLLVGAPGLGSGAGAAYLALGPVAPGADLGVADAVLRGQSAGDAAGSALAGCGDLDGDGYEDFLIGAPSNDGGAAQGGAVYLRTGHSGAWRDLGLAFADGRLLGGASGEALGTSLSAAGDTDADGVLEVILGAPGAAMATSAAGGAWRVAGAFSGTAAVSAAALNGWAGKAADDAAGAAVAGGVDLDADGFDDLLIGAPGLDDFATGLSEVGGVSLIRGTGL